MNIEFIDALPEDGRKRRYNSHYIEFANALRARPHVWAKFVPENGTSRGYVNAINTGKIAAFRGGEFEAAERDGQVYVRFIGASL